jgi:hypothetical protein
VIGRLSLSRPWYLVGAVVGFLIGFYGGEFRAPVSLFFTLIVKIVFGLGFALVGISIAWLVNVLQIGFKSGKLASIGSERASESDQTAG